MKRLSLLLVLLVTGAAHGQGQTLHTCGSKPNQVPCLSVNSCVYSASTGKKYCGATMAAAEAQEMAHEPPQTADKEPSEAVKTCQHAYMCPGVDTVTVSRLTPAEKKELANAAAKAAAAESAYREVQNKIITDHGGYILPDCSVTGYGCMTSTGQRLSDEVEWKGDYLILTKQWEPEL